MKEIKIKLNLFGLDFFSYVDDNMSVMSCE